MKCAGQSRAKSETEKWSGPDTDNPRENSEKNCADGKFLCRGLHGNDQGELVGTGLWRRSIR
jgi:hypothetical protein